ncbi:FAD-dependent monooxygenase [Cellulomonas marina]|uniref:2-polyprenyl-6-methoxyphenol hydroxylase n=1 Tax=Cellulomonas marina TaxID=988821 RepID=A0A1I1AVI7_9CELL|nr:FAD-dependent monooxygenase [Cellulomonas marina]GIG30701.1 hypothetical protein Cma02nite_33010 [Cellulomonas marina]SFB42061.1 2-polyprenyl-6-methoxyphenol hydroxylase [Cellulomonas marina]
MTDPGAGPARVVVVGAGVAGLLAAAAVAGDGRRTTLVEKDVLPDAPASRPGTPQDRHPHVLLHRGLLAAETVLPGLREDLRRAGAVPVDTGRLAWLGEQGWAPRSRQYEVLSATRPLVEHVLRTRVRALPGVVLRDGTRVDGLARGDDAAWHVHLADGATLAADLVVDASGRTSRLPVWLTALGLPEPRTQEVDARIGYASRAYALDRERVTTAGVVLLASPGRPVGGLALPVEDGRWLVGQVGVGEQRPGREPDAFLAGLAALQDPVLAELAAAAEPASDVAVHRRTANRRHAWERRGALPDEVLVVGDALCAFNPIYGQGVAVAALEAAALRAEVRRGWRPRRSARRLQRRFARTTALPWAIATGEDLRYPTVAGREGPVAALLGRWTRELGRLAAHGDTATQERVASVFHLMAPPLVLLHPRLLAAGLRARLRGYGTPVPRPQVLVPASSSRAADVTTRRS